MKVLRIRTEVYDTVTNEIIEHYNVDFNLYETSENLVIPPETIVGVIENKIALLTREYTVNDDMNKAWKLLLNRVREDTIR